MRLLAVAHDNDSELVASLARLAREDADAQVRLAALKRLADPGITQGVAHDDTDPLVRTQARALWLDLLAGTHARAPSLAERMRLLRAQDDGELVEHIARVAREPELRRAALDRVTRSGVLFDRALHDSDVSIRVGLVERIDDEGQLARLVERARKTDKQVSRRARERIDALRIARGDDATLEQRARLLCERLEHLIREPRRADIEVDIARRWSEIEASAPAGVRTRFSAAQSLLVASRIAPRTPVPAADPADCDCFPATPAVDPPLDKGGLAPAGPAESTEPPGEPDDVAAPLLAQARFAASLDEAAVEKRQLRERQQALLGELDDALAAIESAIDSGASAQAHAAKARADDLRRRIDSPLPREVAQRLATTETRYAELSRWQHWADNQRRRQLCDEIEALATTGLHPDAVASRVREAQAEWARLDAIEGRDGAKPGGLARQFHAACRSTLAPTQAYFRKRQELRQSHAQGVTALLDRVNALNDDDGVQDAGTDWTMVATLRREIVEALRGLDSVEPRQRKLLAQRLKISLGSLDARVAHRDEGIERAKAALIAQALAFGEGTPQRSAVAAARELQQRWQAVGNGRRARDQAQWKSFRAAIDAVFAKLDAERNERGAREAGEHAQAESMCSEMEALAESVTPPERGAISPIQSAWEALRVRDEALVRRFGAAQTRLREAAERRERARRHLRFDAWLMRYRLCRAAEQQAELPPDVSERWNAAAPTDIAPLPLAHRFETAVQGRHDDAPDNAPFRSILLELEYLAGIEPDESDRERHRLLQVQRLSARLRGDAMTGPSDELAKLLARWTTLGAVPDARLDARLERGLARAMETLP